MPARIASLVPAATDLVVALGLGDELVGVSHECDRSNELGLATLTASLVPAAGTADGAAPEVVDAAVRAALADQGVLYTTNAQQLADLAPTHVLAQSICDVCAIRADQVDDIVPAGAELVVLAASSLASLEDDIRSVASALDAEHAAAELLDELRGDLYATRFAVRSVERPRVLTIEWGAPPFIGGHWVPELVDLAGGTNVMSSPGEPSRAVDWDAISAADPDVVVFLPCGYDLPTATAEANALLAGPAADLRAVRDRRFWAVDADRLFSRCTPVVGAAARVLGGILHPDLFDPPSATDAWNAT